MTKDSPFNVASPSVPIIGAPVVQGAVVVVQMTCICDTKPPMQIAAGTLGTCQRCSRCWHVVTELKLQVQPVVVRTVES